MIAINRQQNIYNNPLYIRFDQFENRFCRLHWQLSPGKIQHSFVFFMSGCLISFDFSTVVACHHFPGFLPLADGWKILCRLTI